ncbi:hypothetical protein HYV83_00265 [Candidatus Woesearchaeota archaeon]|nr:hypothetical protein [Candidatus Woesearchaeota archaeon]
MASLRLFFISVVLLVAVVSAALDVAAVEKVVKISKVSAVKNSEALVIVSLESKADNADSKVTVSIPELGLRERRNVDFSKTNKKSVHFELSFPDVFDPFVKVVFNSDDGRRVKYRPLILQ